MIPQQTNLPIRIRSLHKADIPFIKNAWMKSLRDNKPFSLMRTEDYYRHQSKICDEILQSADSIVACLDTDEDEILGFCVLEAYQKSMLLHFVFVKNCYRKFGIGTELLQQAKRESDPYPMIYTTRTHATGKISKYLPKTFNPYLLYETR